MTALALSPVQPVAKVDITRSYHRVAGANILVCTPARLAPGTEGVVVVSMHGGLNPSLESPFLKALAEYGVQTAFCVPDKSSFIDQFRSMDACMALFRQMADTVALMSAYQKIAENGAQVFQGNDRPLSIPDMQLRAADGLLLLDANFGTTVMHLMSINPAWIEDGASFRIDPALDPLRPENGYAPDGQSAFPEEFKARFLSAQRARYNELLDKAQARWQAIQRGESAYRDNEPFIVPGAIGINNAPKLFSADLRLLSHTASPWPLIHPDGTITTQIVPSVRRDQNNPGFAGNLNSAYVTTVKDYLWSAVTVEENYDYGRDYLSGIGFESSFTCSSGNVAMISCPLLLMGHTGGYEFIAAEWSYLRAASRDKAIAFLEGATHGWTPVDPAYGDTLGLEARFVIQWLAQAGRFAKAGAEATPPEATMQGAAPDASALRAGLLGYWQGEAAGAFARFEQGGNCELSFAASWTQFEITADGALHFHDRYGGSVVLPFTPEPRRAGVDRGVFHLKDDLLCLEGVRLHRLSEKTQGQSHG